MNFPDHFINPNLKNKEFHLNMVKAGYEEWESVQTTSFLKGATRYAMNDLYAAGQQPVDTFKEMYTSDSDSNETHMNIDFSPIAIIPKYIRLALGRLSKFKDSIICTAIDPIAQKERVEYETKERANIKVRDDMASVGVDASILNTGEKDQPMTNDELDMKMEFTYKHNMAMDTEKRIALVFDENNMAELRDKIRKSLFKYGVAAFRDWTDDDGRVKIRDVNMGRFITSPTEDPFFRDIWYAGEVQLIPLQKVRHDAKDMSAEDFEELAERFESIQKQNNPNDTVYHQYGSRFDGILVPVLDFQFLTIDESVYEQWENPKTKRPSFMSAPYKKRGKEVRGRKHKSEFNLRVHKVKWIVDTNWIYDWGPENDQKHTPSKPWYTTLDYHVIAPEMNNMNTVSMVDHMKPFVDAIQLAYLKLQNVIAQAIPKGIQIELTGLENITLGEGMENMDPMQIIEMFKQSGVLVYRAIDPSGSLTPSKPIEELDMGLGQQAQEYFGLIQNYMNVLSSMIGFNDVTDGSTPDARMLNGVASMAMEGTNNALQFLVDAERNLLERVASSAAIRIHDSIYRKKSKVYENALGTEGLKSFGERAGEVHREYGIKVMDRGDQMERERFQIRVEKALDKQTITLGQATTVENLDNLKQAEMLLAHYEKQNRQAAAEQAEQDKMGNAQVQVQSAQAAEEAKQGTINIQANADVMVEREKALAQIELLKAEAAINQGIATQEIEAKLRERRMINVNAVDIQELKNEGQLAAVKARPKPSPSQGSKPVSKSKEKAKH
jgi:hypothetical protein